MENIIKSIMNLRSCANCQKSNIEVEVLDFTVIRYEDKCAGCYEYSMWEYDNISSENRWDIEL